MCFKMQESERHNYRGLTLEMRAELSFHYVSILLTIIFIASDMYIIFIHMKMEHFKGNVIICISVIRLQLKNSLLQKCKSKFKTRV